MVTLPSRLVFLGACAAALLLSGCDRLGGNWLVGKWTLDKELTIANLTAGDPAAPESPGEGFLKELANGLQKGVSRLLLTPFEGTVLEFTATERRRTRDGSGEVTTYEILERPAGDRYVLKFADGEISTWSRHAGGIRMLLPGEQENWIYFKAAP